MPDQSPTLPTEHFSRLEGLKRQSDQLASLSAMLRERSERCELGCDSYGAEKAKGVDKRSREQDREEVQEQLAKIMSKLDERRSGEKTLDAFSEKVLDIIEKNHRSRMTDMMKILESMLESGKHEFGQSHATTGSRES